MSVDSRLRTAAHIVLVNGAGGTAPWRERRPASACHARPARAARPPARRPGIGRTTTPARHMVAPVRRSGGVRRDRGRVEAPKGNAHETGHPNVARSQGDTPTFSETALPPLNSLTPQRTRFRMYLPKLSGAPEAPSTGVGPSGRFRPSQSSRRSFEQPLPL